MGRNILAVLENKIMPYSRVRGELVIIKYDSLHQRAIHGNLFVLFNSKVLFISLVLFTT